MRSKRRFQILLDLRHIERSPALHAQQYARGQVLDARHGGAHVGGGGEHGHGVVVPEAGIRALDGVDHGGLGFGDAHEEFGELGVVHGGFLFSDPASRHGIAGLRVFVFVRIQQERGRGQQAERPGMP
jgi:hypothetical protein